MTVRDQGTGVMLIHRQAVEATVVRGCAACGAPGVYHEHESVAASWPGCHVAIGDPRARQPVGATCPNCGAARASDEPLGVVWTNGGGATKREG